MSRRDWIIEEAEQGVGLELDGNFEPGVNGLCDGDTCRHAECDCWGSFQAAVEEQLEKQQKAYEAECASMQALYRGEVTAGIHVPAYEQGADR